MAQYNAFLFHSCGWSNLSAIVCFNAKITNGKKGPISSQILAMVCNVIFI